MDGGNFLKDLKKRKGLEKTDKVSYHPSLQVEDITKKVEF